MINVAHFCSYHYEYVYEPKLHSGDSGSEVSLAMAPALTATVNSARQAAVLTFVVVLGGDSEDGMLDVLVLVHFRLVQRLVEERGIVILVGDPNADELRY